MPDAVDHSGMAQGSPHTAKNPDIEKLRAVAILMVVLWHYSGILLEPFGLSTRFLGSWTGVDLFFCISGYVIMKSLVAALPDARMVRFLSSFYIKRIFRIWPSAFGCIGAALVLAFVTRKFNGPALYHDTASDAWPAILNYANWAYYYKTTNHGSTLLGIFWSLSLEEQFYLIIPLCVWFFRRRLQLFGWLLLIPAAWQFCLEREPWRVLMWSLRTDALIFGVIIAILELNCDRQMHVLGEFLSARRKWVSFALIPLLVLLLATVASAFGRGYTSIPTSWAGAIGAVLVLVAATNRGLILDHPWISPALLWIGSRSFSMYLFHNLALVIARGLNVSLLHLTLDPGNLGYYLFVASTGLLLCTLCEANYRLMEVPLRNVGRKIAG